MTSSSRSGSWDYLQDNKVILQNDTIISQKIMHVLSDNYVGLQENDLKRARALKKAKVEQELGRQKDKEIER